MPRNYSKREVKEYNLFRVFLQWLFCTVGYANWYRLCCGYKVLGRENLPKNEFYIVASNHNSAVDPFLMCNAITKSVAYMAKKELFETFWSALYMNLLGSFSVDRGKTAVSTIKTVINISKTKNWVLGIFPQGTRGAVGDLEHINRGFASLAKTLKCSVVPVGIIGATKEERRTKGKRLIFNIGKPIPYNDDPEAMIKVWREQVIELTDTKKISEKLEKPKPNYTRKYAKDFNILTRLYQLYAINILYRPFAALFYKFKFSGKKNLENGKRYVFAPNHISYFDPFLSAMATGRKQAFMAKKELFEGTNYGGRYLARNVWLLGAFSVNREKPEASTIKSCIEAARAKWNLCIFPQGGIRKNKKIEDVNKGFVALAKKSKMDIVPISITGVENYNWKLFKRRLVEVKVGAPISFCLGDDEIVNEWRKQVSKMSGYELL